MSTINTQGFGIQLAPAGFPLEANKVFTTLALAQEFIKTKPAAYVGSVISVTNDTTENNGVYLVESIGTNGSLKKVGSDISLDGYATEQWVEGKGYLTDQDLSDYAKKSDLTIVYKYKGSVTSFENLPTEGLNNGDVYNVETTGINYAWVEETGEWDKLGGHEDLSGYDNKIENIKVKSDAETVETLTIDESDKSVIIDLSGITDSIEGKQDKLENGSSEKPHLIWANGKWAPGKIETPESRLVPETTNVESPAILAFDGTNIIWTSSELQKELPKYDSSNNGDILQVNSEGELIWTSAPNNTTITNTTEETVVISSIISNGSEEVEVYSKEGVNKLLSWEAI